MRQWVLSAALVGACLPGVAAADVYSYQQDNGTFAFTDNPEQVPARYRNAVKQSPDQPITAYPRTTIRLTPATPPKRDATSSPALAFLAQEYAAQQPRPEQLLPQAYIQAGPGLVVPIPSHQDGQGGEDLEPIRVERVYRWIDGRYTLVVRVRRGDQILVETEERATRLTAE